MRRSLHALMTSRQAAAIAARPFQRPGEGPSAISYPTSGCAHSAEARVQNFSGMFSTRTVFYDDIAVGTSPLAVTVVSFTAHRAGKGVLLRWRTGTEVNELGFNVYRQQGARRVRVNRRLHPALGAMTGSSYSYRDRRAPQHRALRYWLQDVAVDGTRTWHGPVSVSGA